MRGRAARSAAPALGVLVLVGLVAVAATGSTPVGTSEGRRPSDTLFDTFFSLGLVLLIPAAAMLVYGLLQRKDVAREIASRRYPRTSVAAYVVFVFVFAGIVYFRYRDTSFNLRGEPQIGDLGADGRRAQPPDVGAEDPGAYQAQFAWIPVLVVLALAAVVALAWVVAGRRARAAADSDEAPDAEELADELEATLDDLRAERDPRRAVVAAFARLERALAAAGVPRARSDTADEFVARALGRLEVGPEAIGRLRGLFVRAKFSHHVVDAAMKEDAIDALSEIRDELQRAEVRRGAGDGDPDVEAPEHRLVAS